MKTFKKVAFTGVFVAAVIVMFVSVSYMLRDPYDVKREHRNRITGFYAEQENSLDAVVLGSSAVYRYVDNPYLYREYGLTSYNFCTPYQTVSAYEYLIDEVNKTQNPDLFIIDARQYITQEDTKQRNQIFRTLVDNMKYSKNRVAIINKMIDSWPERLEFYFDLILYHGNWETFSMEDIEYADNERKNPTKGWKVAVRINESKEVDVTNVTAEKPIPEDIEQELHTLLKKCQNEDIQVMFLSTPCVTDEETQMKSNYVARIVEEYGFSYLDCNLKIDEIGIEFSRDFYNDKHANARGAEKTTEYLGRFIAENFEIDNTHEDSVVNEWNDAVEIYNEQMQKFMERYNQIEPEQE